MYDIFDSSISKVCTHNHDIFEFVIADCDITFIKTVNIYERNMDDCSFSYKHSSISFRLSIFWGVLDIEVSNIRSLRGRIRVCQILLFFVELYCVISFVLCRILDSDSTKSLLPCYYCLDIK